MSRPMLERFWITVNHAWACYYRGERTASTRAGMDALGLADSLGVDTLGAEAYLVLGNSTGGSADPEVAMKHFYRARALAEKAGSREYSGVADKEIGVVYRLMEDYPRSLELLKKAIVNVRSMLEVNRTYCQLSDTYRFMGQADSALYYAHRSNTIREPEEDPYGYARSYYTLGAAYAAKGDRVLAEVHFTRAIEVADSFEVVIPLIQALGGRGRMRLEIQDLPGAITDGRRALAVSLAFGHLSLTARSADLLRAAYKAQGRLDSAFHYSEMKALFNDSLKTTGNMIKLQNMTFEQDLKEREEARLLEVAATERSRNLQFGIIALIVLTLGIFLLVFSRTAVVGAKAIKNLSLIALLLFFEFINLLVHPFLDRITNHSPILMLLCMATIAGLLIPLHHRMEKLITNMLVSKNNRVRLEAARRTIEELEGAGKTDPVG
ncbi:MAG: tetratricopeptide repeat protein [Flavobacteriales bacterium]|nr:tetratricopeptide repeat protein [Flavobacteriales bacterium]